MSREIGPELTTCQAGSFNGGNMPRLTHDGFQRSRADFLMSGVLKLTSTADFFENVVSLLPVESGGMDVVSGGMNVENFGTSVKSGGTSSGFTMPTHGGCFPPKLCLDMAKWVMASVTELSYIGWEVGQGAANRCSTSPTPSGMASTSSTASPSVLKDQTFELQGSCQGMAVRSSSSREPIFRHLVGRCRVPPHWRA